MEIGLQIITSTALASVIVKLIDVWLKRRERKDAKEDKAAELLERKLETNGATLEAMQTAVMLLLYDKYENLASKYIESGAMTLKQAKVISAMYSSYKALGGDGWADELMEIVKDLPIKER